MKRLQINSTQLAVGVLCALQGALMLVAPYQFAFIQIAWFQERVWLWGVLLFVTGFLLFSASIVSVRPRVVRAIRAFAAVQLALLAASFGWAGVWFWMVNYGLIALVTLFTAFAPQGAFSLPDEKTAIDLFPIVMGVSGMLTGGMLLQMGGQANGLLQFTTAGGQFFGAALIGVGLWLVWAFAQAFRSPTASISPSAWIPTMLMAGLYWAFLWFSMPLQALWVNINYFGPLGLALIVTAWGGKSLSQIQPNSLRNRQALLLAMAAAIPLVITVAIVSQRLEHSGREEALIRQESLAASVAQNVQDFIRLHQAALHTVSMYPNLMGLPLEAQKAVLQHYAEVYPDVSAFILYTAEGTPLIRSDQAPLASTPLLEKDYRRSQPLVEYTYSNALNAPVIRMIVPIEDETGKVTGIAALSMLTDHFANLVALQGLDAADLVYIVSEDGRLIAHPNPAMESSFLTPIENPIVAQTVRSSASTGSMSYVDQGLEQLGGFGRVPEYGWGVIVERSAASVLANIHQNRELAYIVLMVSLLGSVVLGFYLGGYLVAPLHTLAYAANQFADGVTNVPVRFSTLFEIDELASAFQKMRERLMLRTEEAASALQALKLANEDLESRVSERTREQAEVFQALTDAVLVYEPSGKVRQANAAAVRIFGLDPNNQYRDDIFVNTEVRSPDDEQLSPNDLPSARALRGQSLARQHIQFTNRLGQTFQMIATATPLKQGDDVCGAVSVWQDITNLIRVQRTLEERERLMRIMLDNMPIGVWWTDETGRIIYGNPTGQTIWAGAKYVGMEEYHEYKAWWLDTGEPLDSEDWALWRALNRGETSLNETLEIECFDGSRKIIRNSAVPVKDEAERILGAVVLNEDITEQLRSEQALRESESRLRKLVESNLIGIIFSTEDGGIVDANQAFLQMIGYSREELEMGQVKWSELTPAEFLPLDQAAMAEAHQYGVCTPYEKVYLHKDGHPIPILIGYTLIGTSNQEFACFILDLTQRKQSEEAIAAYTRQLERANRELQDFAFIASHDLQEPLRKIQAFGERLQTRYSEQLGVEGKDYLLRMTMASARLQSMINDLLSYSRVTTKAQPYAKIDLNEVLNRVIENLLEEIHEVRGEVQAEPLPSLDADPYQMRLLFEHLIANGLKFRRPGVSPLVKVYGKLLVEGGPASQRQVQICVEDNGIGFDPQYAERIFQPFQRLHGRGEYEGTGIGLAICRKIVERHHGSIVAQSAAGQGATFIVTLPVVQTTKE